MHLKVTIFVCIEKNKILGEIFNILRYLIKLLKNYLTDFDWTTLVPYISACSRGHKNNQKQFKKCNNSRILKSQKKN